MKCLSHQYWIGLQHYAGNLTGIMKLVKYTLIVRRHLINNENLITYRLTFIVFQVKKGNILVIGTQIPWIEAILLEKGAERVTTMEYASVKSFHPNITAITPDIFREMYLNSSINVSEVRLSLYLTAFVLRYLLTY